jgi:hypothetical protein
MTASLLLLRGALTRQPRVQRGSQKPVTVPGAQVGPRDATRELYRQVCNLVGSVLTPPCGVPLSVGEKKPSSTTPAFSHWRSVAVNTGSLANNGSWSMLSNDYAC